MNDHILCTLHLLEQITIFLRPAVINIAKEKCFGLPKQKLIILHTVQHYLIGFVSIYLKLIRRPKSTFSVVIILYFDD